MTVLTSHLGQIAIGLAILVGFWLLARAVRDLSARALARRTAPAEVVLLAQRIIYVAILALGLLLFLPVVLGQENVAVTGFLAAAIATSLGVQDIVRNYVSGFYLLLERHFRVGDSVEIGGKQGVVSDVRLRVTFLRADDGAVIMVPNANLFNDTVIIRPAAGGTEPEKDRAARPKRRGLLARATRTPAPPAGSPPSAGA